MISRAPWNAAWTSEDRYEVRPCRYASGSLAIWSPHSPGIGLPVFAKPHMVRQRRSIAELRCTVCGEKTAAGDRWWFPRGSWQDGLWMSTEAPVHRACADAAMKVCPVLRTERQLPIPFPDGMIVVAAIVGGPATDRDFNVRINGRRVVGHLKLASRSPYWLASEQNRSGTGTAEIDSQATPK